MRKQATVKKVVMALLTRSLAALDARTTTPRRRMSLEFGPEKGDAGTII